MRSLDFATVTPREIAPGYLGRYLHSDHITQGRVDIAQGAVVPEHSHPHEQYPAAHRLPRTDGLRCRPRLATGADPLYRAS